MESSNNGTILIAEENKKGGKPIFTIRKMFSRGKIICFLDCSQKEKVTVGEKYVVTIVHEAERCYYVTATKYVEITQEDIAKKFNLIKVEDFEPEWISGIYREDPIVTFAGTVFIQKTEIFYRFTINPKLYNTFDIPNEYASTDKNLVDNVGNSRSVCITDAVEVEKSCPIRFHIEMKYRYASLLMEKYKIDSHESRLEEITFLMDDLAKFPSISVVNNAADKEIEELYKSLLQKGKLVKRKDNTTGGTLGNIRVTMTLNEREVFEKDYANEIYGITAKHTRILNY